MTAHAAKGFAGYRMSCRRSERMVFTGLDFTVPAGGALLLMADVLARSLNAPQEVPVGVLTAILGGSYLIWLLQRRRSE